MTKILTPVGRVQTLHATSVRGKHVNAKTTKNYNSQKHRYIWVMKKYQNKYRIESARLKNYDYSSNGAYFITICTKNREHFFGEIIDNKMVLNEIGKIAQQYWNEIPRHFPFIKLDEMVVMPNHIHGILWIDDDGGVDDVVHGRDVACNVSTPTATPSSPTNNPKNEKMAKISPKRGSLASVIRSFKSAVTKKSREFNETLHGGVDCTG